MSISREGDIFVIIQHSELMNSPSQVWLQMRDTDLQGKKKGTKGEKNITFILALSALSRKHFLNYY